MICIYIALYLTVFIPTEMIVEAVREVLRLSDASVMITAALVALLITENIYKWIF